MKQCKILIVDSDRISSTLLEHVLIEVGYDVVGTASNSISCLDLFQELLPTMVLMSIRLPGEMDGIETSQQIQQIRKTPIEFTTNYEDREVFQKALETNPSGYVVKPYDRHNLVCIIEMAKHRFGLEEELNKKEKELRSYNKSLEEKVKQRTLELAKKNKELEIALTKERELNEYRQKIVTTVSHEFKTPLTTISSSAQLMERLLDRPDFAPKARRHLSMIDRSVDIINRLLKNVTKHRQLESTQEANLRVIEVNDFFDKLLSYFQEGVACDHTLQFENNCTKLKIESDEELLWEICSNLLSNAVKYSERGTEILIQTGEYKTHFKCCITDQGQGIRDEEKSKIFDYFYRSQVNENIEGSGIGLNIVKRALELLNGEITVESEFGKGATFCFILPVRFNE